MSIYSFQARLSNGKDIRLDTYQGQVIVIVNTASKCGLTPQYEGLEALYETYQARGLTILGFPCNQFGGQEPGSNEEIRSFCSLEYQVTFPLFQKIEVNGEHAHPLYQYLREQAPEDADLENNGPLTQLLREKKPDLLEGSKIRWNFTKFLIDQQGTVVKRFAPTTKPEALIGDIEALLGN